MLRATAILTVRALRESIKQPWLEFGNIFIPLFFFAVTVGAIENVAQAAFGVSNFTGFQLPVAILQAVAGSSGNGGLGMTNDIQKGYFDKLLLTPVPRGALVLGRMAADGLRAVFFTSLILVVGWLFGAGMAAGPLGAVVVLLAAGLFGLSYSGIGMAIALKTGSPQAAQAGFLVFFPLLFLAPALAPKDVFSGWLGVAATLNPVTYLLEGMRALVLEGWDTGAVLRGFAALAGIGAFTGTLTYLGFRSRRL